MKQALNLLAIFAILIFCGLLLCSCEDYYPPPGADYLCYVDSLGIPHQYALPSGTTRLSGIKRLKDGHALIIGNKLHIWNPVSNMMTDITPSGFISASYVNNVDCSLDGRYIYFAADGKIKRMQLDNLVQETLVDSTGAIFFAPTLSKNQRYLAFLRATPGATGPLYTGYPLFLNLISGEVMSLPYGNLQFYTKVDNVFVDSYRERIYYNVESGLYTMDMDGSHRAYVYSNFPKAQLTQDGNFMVSGHTVESRYTLFYRDNRNMGWRYFEASGENALAHNSNYMYYNKLKALYRMDLDTGLGSKILPTVVFGKKLMEAWGLAPAWDGKDLVCIVKLYMGDNEDF